ncbi:MAG TPA: maleylpyruvate isomerase N-terminal domain-containing protein [Longimicrobiaceae bacterium]|nr:maleylpyruvate isomerase N-terminal domain-containing protein [Longimicrobiaceae bacterium]
MIPVEPVHVAERFGPLHAELIALLSSLSDEEWRRPTAAPLWTVKDVAAHLLDGDVRQLSFRRDGMPPPPPDRPIDGYRGFVAFLDHINAVWVDAARRISPRLLVELHGFTGPEVARLFEGLDPRGPALFPVAWAGEETSANWMDTAREYTERWHHQQQIRDAVGRAPLTGREWLHPVLDTFVRALPHAYRDVDAPEGTAVLFAVTGEAGDEWTLLREGGRWTLHAGAAPRPDATVTADADAAWRLFTKGLSREAAEERVRIEGERRLGEPVLGALAIMG